MKNKMISADEARSLRADQFREVGGKEVMLKASKPFKTPRSWDDDTRSVRFVMSSESVDRYGDIVGQAGMDVTKFLENGTALMFHNSRSWPIGSWTDVEKNLTGRPRRTEGTLNFLAEGVEPDADRAARHVKAGSIRTVSIGFRPKWDTAEMIVDKDGNSTGGIKFNESELLECSLVPIPAQADAIVKDAGGDFALAKQTIEEILDTWTRSPEGLLIPRTEYEKVYRSIIIPMAVRGLDLGTRISAESRALIKNAAAEMATQEAEEIELDVEELAIEITATSDDVGVIEPDVEKTVEDVVSEVEASIEVIADIKVGDDPIVKTITEPTSIEFEVEIDTAGLDKATEKASALETLIDRVMNKMAKLFGSNKEAAPVIEQAPPAPPKPEEIAAAMASAKAVRERLIAKGLIEA